MTMETLPRSIVAVGMVAMLTSNAMHLPKV
jgi:hypothetical protein